MRIESSSRRQSLDALVARQLAPIAIKLFPYLGLRPLTILSSAEIDDPSQLYVVRDKHSGRQDRRQLLVLMNRSFGPERQIQAPMRQIDSLCRRGWAAPASILGAEAECASDRR